jgi:hypothetical protein
VHKASAFKVEMATEKLKRHKSPGTDEIPAELIKAGGRKIHSEVHNLLILFGIKRYCLSSGRNQSLYLFIRRVIKQTVVIMDTYNSCQLHTKFYQTSFFQGYLHIQRKLLGTNHEPWKGWTSHISKLSY